MSNMNTKHIFTLILMVLALSIACSLGVKEYPDAYSAIQDIDKHPLLGCEIELAFTVNMVGASSAISCTLLKDSAHMSIIAFDDDAESSCTSNPLCKTSVMESDVMFYSNLLIVADKPLSAAIIEDLKDNESTDIDIQELLSGESQIIDHYIPDGIMTINELDSEFHANQLAFQQKYQDRQIEIAAAVNWVGPSPDVLKGRVTFGSLANDDYTRINLGCELDISDALELTTGSAVIVTFTFRGISYYDIDLENCSVRPLETATKSSESIKQDDSLVGQPPPVANSTSPSPSPTPKPTYTVSPKQTPDRYVLDYKPETDLKNYTAQDIYEDLYFRVNFNSYGCHTERRSTKLPGIKIYDKSVPKELWGGKTDSNCHAALDSETNQIIGSSNFDTENILANVGFNKDTRINFIWTVSAIRDTEYSEYEYVIHNTLLQGQCNKVHDLHLRFMLHLSPSGVQLPFDVAHTQYCQSNHQEGIASAIGNDYNDKPYFKINDILWDSGSSLLEVEFGTLSKVELIEFTGTEIGTFNNLSRHSSKQVTPMPPTSLNINKSSINTSQEGIVIDWDIKKHRLSREQESKWVTCGAFWTEDCPYTLSGTVHNTSNESKTDIFMDFKTYDFEGHASSDKIIASVENLGPGEKAKFEVGLYAEDIEGFASIKLTKVSVWPRSSSFSIPTFAWPTSTPVPTPTLEPSSSSILIETARLECSPSIATPGDSVSITGIGFPEFGNLTSVKLKMGDLVDIDITPYITYLDFYGKTQYQYIQADSGGTFKTRVVVPDTSIAATANYKVLATAFHKKNGEASGSCNLAVRP